MPSDEPAPNQALAALEVLRGRADGFFERVLGEHADDMRCAPGCASCCRPGLSVFTAEAVALRAALRQLQQHAPELRDRVRAQGQEDLPSHCPLLVDDRCAVYAARPLICRTHGLPTIDSDATDASSDAPSRLGTRRLRGLPIVHCELNFSAEPSPGGAAPLRSENVMDLAALNRPLAVIAELFEAGAPRVLLASLAVEP